MRIAVTEKMNCKEFWILILAIFLAKIRPLSGLTDKELDKVAQLYVDNGWNSVSLTSPDQNEKVQVARKLMNSSIRVCSGCCDFKRPCNSLVLVSQIDSLKVLKAILAVSRPRQAMLLLQNSIDLERARDKISTLVKSWNLRIFFYLAKLNPIEGLQLYYVINSINFPNPVINEVSN